MKEPLFIGIYILASFYSFFLQLRYFRKKIKVKRILFNETIVLVIIILINIILAESFNWNLMGKYISSKVFLLDLHYLFIRLQKNKNKKLSENLLRTSLVSIFSASVFIIITSIKFGSAKYVSSYLITVLIIIFIESIIFLILKKN